MPYNKYFKKEMEGFPGKQKDDSVSMLSDEPAQDLSLEPQNTHKTTTTTTTKSIMVTPACFLSSQRAMAGP